MNKLVKKIAQNSLYIIILNTLINCPSVKAQFPRVGCYMIDEFGQMINLYFLCNLSVSQEGSNNNQNSQPPSQNQPPQGNESPANNQQNSQPTSPDNNTNTPTSQPQNSTQAEDRSKLPIVRKTIPIINQQQQQIEENTQNKK